MTEEYSTGVTNPSDICCDGAYIYIACDGNERIVTLDLDFNLIATKTTFNGADTFSGLRGICCDNAGNVYVVCQTDGRAIKFTAAAGVLTYDSEVAIANQPVAIDTDGTYLFIGLALVSYVRKYLCSDLSYDSEAAVGSGPRGICNDGTYIYITCIGLDAVQKRNISNLALVSSFGSTGAGDDNFDQPYGIATDGIHLYICDRDNSRIKRHLLAGTYVDEAADNINQVFGVEIVSLYSIAHTETPSRVTENGTELTTRATYALCAANASSWYYDSTNQSLYVHTSGSDTPTGYIIMSFGWWELLSTHAGDYNSKPYLSRLEKSNIPNVSSSVSGPHEGIVTQSLGEIRINNLDARYDARLASYVYEGAKIILYRGIKDDDYANFDDFLHAYVGRWECDENHLTFYLEDFRDYI